MLNIVDRLPKRLWKQVHQDLCAASMASTRAKCQTQLARIAGDLRYAEQAAAETMLRDLDEFLTFYDFPSEH